MNTTRTIIALPSAGRMFWENVKDIQISPENVITFRDEHGGFMTLVNMPTIITEHSEEPS